MKVFEFNSQMQGKTTGWVGINFSKFGGMSNADVVVGSVNGGDDIKVFL